MAALSFVTVLGLTTPAVAGAVLTITSVTLPGYSCVALFNPPAGARIASTPALADATGTVVNTVPLPIGIQPGTGSATVVCTDPSNPANTASSVPVAVTLVSSAALSVSASLVSTSQPLAPAGLVTIGVLTSPGTSCSISGVIGSLGSTPVTEASGAGVAGVDGSLTLAFHLPAGVVSGTAVATITCIRNGAMTTAQVPVLVGNAPSTINCAGLGGGAAPASAVPVANAGSSYVASAGEPLQFIGAGSAPSVGAVLTTWVWNFGDDSRATTLNPVHTFGAAGVFTVSLTVSDSAGLSATSTAVARIGPYLPLCSQPSLTGTDALGICVAALTCASTSLPTQCLPPCSTLLPAAMSITSPCPQPSTSVRISTGGPYSVAVSQSASFQGSVVVVGTRRLCSADATLGTGGPFCRLAPAVDLPIPVSYTWDFGDGTNATGSSTGHAYGQAGTYVVTLTVTFDNGSKANASTVAQVSSLTPAAIPTS